MLKGNGIMSTFDSLRHVKTKESASTPISPKPVTIQKPIETSNLSDTFEAEKKKNSGLIERLYNKIKNVTGLGVLRKLKQI